jgi:8-amino-7-oxononanoate synthase
MATPSVLAQWFPDHTLKALALPSSTPAFFRNLEEVMDTRRTERSVFLVRSGEPAPGSIDFSSLDYLSLSKSGLIRQRYLEEVASHPNFDFGSGGSRLLNGNMPYTEATERELAAFYNDEAALIFHSGFEANAAIMTAVARPGDAIVYDEFVHASMHEGMQSSFASVKVSFMHNDVESFREALQGVLDTNLLIKEGKKNVLVCVESVYSMDGDTAPVHELLRAMKEICPKGNAQLFLDEAHSAGICGEKGRGFANMLGVEKEIALRMYSSAKALSANGGTEANHISLYVVIC